VIHGVVRAGREAVIRLTVRGPGSTVQIVDAIVDTGFDGFITLPSSLIDALRLPRIARSRVTLADGSVVPVAVYGATVLWDGEWVTVDATSIEADALVGMGLLTGYRFCLDAVAGGRVTIEALS
jgi:clan AA aspartic protease